ncbi:hypothetical protein F442_12101 [Phytophthora nicotianae P10297]|uniref:RxLR effector protein n=7 Tax=Phytophthora nicotianae TaxID=4792 RepID=W2PZ81_PHYN3|nr:hypothetical protein PPTG_13809 [Phytophthora nicotianae INRA-310]ETO71356.1 hypothetical protein F444_12287 [Phytophthora nicotianae P1976]ETP40598.1 hypothetical protein F442_12101 [Phytophthora nicotianae P10297]KUF78023.1 hypothetical protein AM587_10008706 [Phytophthora nicotianae]ETN05961.1 hypothetical protein PPTG_13809 [Phytophthora nicotianae INRA-310]KUF88256.1 hypothetical protein AM588_10002682 [Phytophthora nicotianae]
MRLANVLLVVIVVVIAGVSTTLAASDKSRLLRLATSTANANGYSTNIGGDNNNVEERAINLSDAKQWIKTMFKNWYQKWLTMRHEKAAKELANDVSPGTIEKMLQNKAFQRDMFKKWNKYRMEDIKLKLGENMNNADVAAMLLNYVQNYRVYRNKGWKVVQ